MIPKITIFHKVPLVLIWAVAGLVLAACRAGTTPAPAPSAEVGTGTAAPLTPAPASATLTPTSAPPSPTPQPMAAIVNGDPIFLADYQAELARYEAAVGTQLATQAGDRVMDDLIERLLLAQAAAQRDFQIGDAELDARILRLQERLGGEQPMLDWFTANGYDMASFRRDLARDLAAAWMRDQIAAGVPEAVEQVHARQILLYNSDEAGDVLAQLNAGSDFGELAGAYDPVASGDLGWFPQGYLLDPALDEAAFRLQPEEISQVIATRQGFVILQVLERDPARSLAPDARLALQEQALRAWLQARRDESTIEILQP